MSDFEQSFLQTKTKSFPDEIKEKKNFDSTFGHFVFSIKCCIIQIEIFGVVETMSGEKSLGLLDLPDSCLIEIMERLPLEFFPTLCLTCKKFRSLSAPDSSV